MKYKNSCEHVQGNNYNNMIYSYDKDNIKEGPLGVV